MLAGSFGLFFTLFLLFCRFLPVVAMAEVKTVMPQAHPHHGHDGDGRTTTPQVRLPAGRARPATRRRGDPDTAH